jgi:osmotically inducible protein OsmC
MKRTATARWSGGLKDGKGTLGSTSGVLKDTPYSYHTRFEEAPGTNPEELIAAAHAGCFAMASSAEIEKLGKPPASAEVTCTVTLEPVDGKPTVTSSHLVAKYRVPGADAAQVRAAVEGAKAGCPISRLLNAKITLDASIEV